jgi:hypothetical protein
VGVDIAGSLHVPAIVDDSNALQTKYIRMKHACKEGVA